MKAVRGDWVVCIGKGFRRRKNPIIWRQSRGRKFSGGGVEWRWATAAVATAAVALRAEVSRACAAQAAFAP